MKTSTNGYHSDPPGTEIHEGQGRVPLWIWLVIGICVAIAFLIGPFRVF